MLALVGLWAAPPARADEEPQCAVVVLGECADGSQDPRNDPVRLRRALLQSLTGVWGRQDLNCSKTVDYSVEHVDGQDRIVVRAENFESVGQVVAADRGVVISRDTASAGGAREQWELHPDGDRMVVFDRDGVATTLIRCPTPPS